MATIALWHLCDTADSSGNGNTLTNSGTTFVQAKFGLGAYFDGNSYLYGGTMPTGAFTWMFWIKMAPQAKYLCGMKTVGGETMFDIYTAVDGTLSLHKIRNNQYDFGSLSTVAGKFIFDAWNFISVTIDGASWKIYHNGVEVAATSSGNADAITAAPVLLGCTSANNVGWTPTNHIIGYIDEFTLYNTNLSATQILSEYNKRVKTSFSGFSPWVF